MVQCWVKMMVVFSNWWPKTNLERTKKTNLAGAMNWRPNKNYLGGNKGLAPRQKLIRREQRIGTLAKTNLVGTKLFSFSMSCSLWTDAHKSRQRKRGHTYVGTQRVRQTE